MKLQAQHIGFDNAVAILNQGIQAIDSGDSVMDMQDVRKTDSAAVAVVLEWIRRAQARGAELKVINAPDSFQNLVKLYSLSDFLMIRRTPRSTLVPYAPLCRYTLSLLGALAAS